MNKELIFNYLLFGMVAFLPLYTRIVSGANVTRTSKEIALCLFAIFAGSFLDKKNSMPKNIVYVISISLLCLFLNQYDPAFFGTNYQLIMVSSASFLFLIIYERTENIEKFILNGMAVGCLIQSVFSIFEHNNIYIYRYLINIVYPFAKFPIIYASEGSFGNSNSMAAYLAITFFALLRKRFIYFTPIALTGIFYTSSDMGIVTIVGGLLYLAWLKLKLNRFIPFLAISLSFVIIFLIGVNGQDSDRFFYWREIFSNVSLKHFFIGNGAGWFLASQVEKGSSYFNEHNSLITIFNLLGFFGLGSFLYFYLKAIPKEFSIFSVILFAFYCNFHGHFTLSEATMAIIFIPIFVIGLKRSSYGFHARKNIY